MSTLLLAVEIKNKGCGLLAFAENRCEDSLLTPLNDNALKTSKQTTKRKVVTAGQAPNKKESNFDIPYTRISKAMEQSIPATKGEGSRFVDQQASLISTSVLCVYSFLC